MSTNEYDEIFNQYIGFMFDRSASGKLSDPEPLSAEDCSGLSVGYCNEDYIYIYCKPCGMLMDFRYGPTENLDGKWICPECGKTVREITPYRILDRLNLQYNKEIESDDDYEDYYG